MAASAIPYGAGAPIKVQLPGGLVTGTIREINGKVATVELPVPLELATAAHIIWPDGSRTTLGPGTAIVQSRLTVSLPAGQGAPSTAPRAELRRHPRYNVTLPIRITDLADPKFLVGGRTLNISVGGALLLCNAELATRHRYLVSIEVGAEEVRIQGDVLRQVGHQTFGIQWRDEAPGRHLVDVYFKLIERATGELPAPDSRARDKAASRDREPGPRA
ncbi:MAG: PilZ domain-containing protein [Candidatus Sericytochromatia bacterium]|nr:PilZ domain-containing protein [Candidatus Tanganyikabacteria bacterium]